MTFNRRPSLEQKKVVNPKGLIFDIQRFSLKDGYGIRTVIFMKGCPLNCKWCSNPESQNCFQEVVFDANKCLMCFDCVKICTNIKFEKDQNILKNSSCKNCGQCTNVCFSNARQLIGYWTEIDSLIEIIRKDQNFYLQSNGGITVGGGEPTFQSMFLTKFLKKCKSIGIHTAIETCGYSNWEDLKLILNYTDLVLFDIKHIDSKKHKRYTGVDNIKIIQNAVNTSNYAKEMIVRIPLIPDFNNTTNELKSIGDFIKNKLPNVSKIDILPYHSMGESKCIKLGKPYPLNGLRTISNEEIIKAKRIFQYYELDVSIIN